VRNWFQAFAFKFNLYRYSADLFQKAFDNFYSSALRGGSGGGVMFWILYHSQYAPLDKFGGGYGAYPQLPEDSTAEDVADHTAVLDLIREQSKRLEKLNAASGTGGGGDIASVRGGGGGVSQQQRRLLAAGDSAVADADDVCYWAPPVPKGAGCASLAVELSFGGMPWRDCTR
jgi:hypothetical protein